MSGYQFPVEKVNKRGRILKPTPIDPNAPNQSGLELCKAVGTTLDHNGETINVYECVQCYYRFTSWDEFDEWNLPMCPKCLKAHREDHERMDR